MLFNFFSIFIFFEIKNNYENNENYPKNFISYSATDIEDVKKIIKEHPFIFEDASYSYSANLEIPIDVDENSNSFIVANVIGVNNFNKNSCFSGIPASLINYNGVKWCINKDDKNQLKENDAIITNLSYEILKEKSVVLNYYNDYYRINIKGRRRQ